MKQTVQLDTSEISLLLSEMKRNEKGERSQGGLGESWRRQRIRSESVVTKRGEVTDTSFFSSCELPSPTNRRLSSNSVCHNSI